MAISLLKLKEHGSVAEVRQDVVSVVGLSNCMNGQLVNIGDKTKGVIVGFDTDYVLALVVQSYSSVKPGDKVVTTMDEFKVPVGHGVIGRRVNALLEPYDGRGDIKEDMFYPIFHIAPSVLERDPLRNVLETGTKIVDMTLPVGKGQRMLILGDRMTGKTTVCIDAVVNQKGKDVICVYCAIGKSEASMERVYEVFDQEDVWDYGCVVAATAGDSMGQQYLAPYVACSVAEYFMYEKGRDVLVIFDDLTKHAWAYRQISLLLERAPGRDAYPGDIFYIHSQLVERAGKLGRGLGGGSMTHLPIVETQQGDFAGYIPSNTISMTDGQIFLNATLFGEGFKPAIDMGLSVSRIGNRVQWKAMKKPTGMLKLDYVRYKELEKLTRIKAGASSDVEERLQQGKKLEEFLKQGQNDPVPMEEQVIQLYGLQHGLLDEAPANTIQSLLKAYVVHVKENRPELVASLIESRTMSEDIEEGLKHELSRFTNTAV